MISSIPTGTKCLFDTTVFVDFWRKDANAKLLITNALGGNIEGSYSIITDAELWYGVNDSKSARDHKVMLAPHQRYLLNVAIARRSGELMRIYRRHMNASLGDMLIAATAEYHDLLLVSRNTKHFLPLQSNGLISLFSY